MRKKERKEEQKVRKTGKKKVIVLAAVLAITAAAGFAYIHYFNGEEDVSFEPVKEGEMPADITSDVIPSYKKLERALACMVDDHVYVIVTRGEKPTSGFGVSIEKMAMEENDGKTNLIVYAAFEDPEKDTAFSQIITYPLQVVKTNLTVLPDTIELRIQY